jgi:hypothetical protein
MKKKILMLALVLPLLASAQTNENVQPKENSKCMGIVEFFKKAFADIKQSAKDQHAVDKANLAAVKAESKAQWEEAKRTPKQQQEAVRQKQAEQIAAAKAREAEANERIAAAKK